MIDQRTGHRRAQRCELETEPVNRRHLDRRYRHINQQVGPARLPRRLVHVSDHHQPETRTEPVTRPRLHQHVQLGAAQIRHPGAQISERHERATRRPFRHDAPHDLRERLDHREPQPDLAVFRCRPGLRQVHIRWEQTDPHRTAFHVQLSATFRPLRTFQPGRHVLDREVRFQPDGLPGDVPAVTQRVRLVERVVRRRLDRIPQLRSEPFVTEPVDDARRPHRLESVHLRPVLLATVVHQEVLDHCVRVRWVLHREVKAFLHADLDDRCDDLPSQVTVRCIVQLLRVQDCPRCVGVHHCCPAPPATLQPESVHRHSGDGRTALNLGQVERNRHTGIISPARLVRP